MMSPYVREVTWRVGMGNPSLAERINSLIEREAKAGHTLQTIVPITEWRVLVVFEPCAATNDA